MCAFALIQSAQGAVSYGMRSAHRLLLAAITLAQKVTRDAPYENAYLARVGGVTPQELASLELALLRALQWRAQVAPDGFWRANAFLARHPSRLPTPPFQAGRA